MDDSNLAKKLQDMIQEIRDLKTAHQRGLGTTRFYKYSLEIYVDQMTSYDFIARIADGEPTYPAAIMMTNLDEPIVGAGVWYMSVGSTTINSAIMSGWQTVDHTRMTVTLISSSKIAEFRQA